MSQRNKEKAAVYQKEYRDKNLDKLRQYYKEYRSKNKEKIKSQLSAWHQKNKKPKPDLGYNTDTHKKCNRCNDVKLKENFRLHIDNRRGRRGYLSSKCLKCEAEMQSARYNRLKDDPEQKQKHAEWAKERYWKNPEKYRQQGRDRKHDPEYKKYVKQYYDKNRERILANHRNVCKRATVELRDWIIVGRYSQHKNKHLRPILKENKELIEVMRLQTTLKKLTKNGS